MPEKPTYGELKKRIHVLEEELKSLRHKEDYSQIFFMSLDMMCIADIMSAKFIRINPAFTEVLGYEEIELAEKSFLDFVHPDDIASTRKIMGQQLREGADVVDFENRYRAKDGTYRWLSWVSKANKNEGIAYAVARDITDAKQNKDALLKITTLLNMTGQMAKVGGWELDVNTLEVTWTEETYRIIEVPLDYQPQLEEAINFFDPEGRPKLSNAIQRALDDGEPYNLELRFTTATGKHLWVRTLCQPEIVDGKPQKLYGAFQDITEQKKTEKALKNSEERFRRLAENSPDMIFRMSLTDGTYDYVSPASEKIFGYIPDDFYHSPALIKQIIHPDWQDYFDSEWRKLMAGDMPATYEYQIIHKSGEMRWLNQRNALINDDTGTPVYFEGVVTDITEQKLAETKLRESEEKFRSITELSHVGIFLNDAEGKAIYVNSRCAEIVGVPKDKALSFEWVQYLHPDDRDRVVNDWTKAVQSQDSFKMEYRYVHSDGRVVWTLGEASPVRNSQGEVSLFIGTMVDITDRKEAEKTQEILTRRLESLWKISSLKNADLKTICDTILDEITYMTDSPYGFYGLMNEAETVLKIHSWSQSTMADSTVHDKPLVFSIDESGVWGNAVRDRKPFVMNDYREACANKKGLPEDHVALTRILAVPVFEKEKIVALAAVANKPEDYTDQDLQQMDVFLANVQIIIDQKKAEEERSELEKQLHQAQKMESIGHLAGGVAHDFNNMLGVIIGHTQLALMKADADSPFIENLELISTAAKRSAELTQQLLTFARKEPIAPKVLNLNETVAGILTMLQRLIGENIHLSWKPGADLWTIRIDPVQLNQILTNLSVNARDGIGGVGTITITTQNWSPSKDDQKADSEVPPGDYVCLTVSDDGKGIDPDHLKQIFEPFFTTKEFGRGTGLGLSTVYGAVKQNQGFIDVVSEPGQGTTFHTYFPRQQAEVESVEEASSQSLGRREGTILVVEDDQMLLNLTKTMLEESGYTVLAALTADRAITLAKEYPTPIHLLLSDIVMPTMNGKDLRDSLKRIRPEMKVIFMSGYTADIITQQGVIEEDTHFLQKPMSYEELTSKVQDVLDNG